MKTQLFPQRQVHCPHHPASRSNLPSNSIQIFAKGDKNAPTRNSTAEAIEIAALSVAVASQSAVLFSQKRHQISSITPQKEPSPTTSPSFTFLNNPLWITTPLLIAAIARKIASSSTSKLFLSHPTPQAMSRLLSVESSLSQHDQTLQTLSTQVDKLQVRTRLVSRDVTGALKTVQQQVQEQQGVLVGTSLQLKEMKNDIQEVEGLVGALQEVIGKQAGLIKNIITSSSTTAKVETVGGGAATKRSLSKKKKVEESNSSNKSSIEKNSNSNAVVVVEEEVNSSATDEWGRVVVVEGKRDGGDGDGVQVQKNNDGSVSYSF